MRAMALVLLLALQVYGEDTDPREKFVFQDLYGRDVFLSPAAESPASVLFFFSNTCPVARRYVPKMNQLASDYRARGVQFVAVNVSQDDPLDDVARFAMEYEIGFPVVKDPLFDAVKALGISRTPEVTLLDRNFATLYQGRIDDQYRLGGVRPDATRHDLADAIDALLEGRPVPASHVPAEGCVVTVPSEVIAAPGPVSAPDRTTYNVELAGKGVGGVGAARGPYTWRFESSSSSARWVKALRVDGAFQSATFYYLRKGEEARHYLAGALRPGQPVQWNAWEAIELPASAVLHLETTGEALQAPVVRMDVTDRAPEWALTCSASLSNRVEGDRTSSETFLQDRPPQGQPRSVSLDLGHYGTALSVDFVPDEGLPIRLLSLPAVDPREPGPYLLAELPQASGEKGSLRATLNRPRYLSWPTGGAEATKPAITMYTFWATRTSALPDQATAPAPGHWDNRMGRQTEARVSLSFCTF